VQHAVDIVEVERSLRLLIDPGATFEVRALGTERGREVTLSGYFVDAHLAAAQVLRSVGGEATGIYVTLNPTHPDLRARCSDRIAPAKKGGTTGDQHIVKRTRLLFDVDADRPSGISASDKEHTAALNLIAEMEAELSARGWPEPLRGDSGNGGHLIYAIDLPTEDAGLVGRVLAAAHARWGCSLEGVKLKVDTSVANPARISKLYGTLARKGDDIAERPHRMSRILRAPDVLLPVTREQLESLAADFGPKPAEKAQQQRPQQSNHQHQQQPARSSNGVPRTLDVAEWLTRFGFDVSSSGPWDSKYGPATRHILAVCPRNSDHNRGEAFVAQMSSGAIVAGCRHESCTWDWAWLRQLHEAPRTQTTREFERVGVTVVDRPSPPPAPEAPAPVKAAAPVAGTFEHDLELALADVKNAMGSSVSATRQPLFIDAHDLFTREYPATPWLVTGLITRGGVAQFGAEPKSGKTWFALESSIGIATGSRVCNEFFATRGVVAYFFAEDLDRQVRNRVRALLASRGLGPEAIRGRLHVCPRGTTLDVTRDEDLAWVVASCRKLGPIDMLVLDPLRDIHSGKENESDDMSDVMRRMKTLGTILGCTVAFAHHAGKPGKDQNDRRPGQRARGSGAIHGSTDSGIYFGLRGGDGQKSFELGVDVEIKGAGGAGRFNVRLDVVDDDHGEAVRATWVMSREHTTQPTGSGSTATNTKGLTDEDREDDDAVYEFIRELESRDIRLPQRALRDHPDRPTSMGKPITVSRMTASLRRLENVRRLSRIRGVFQVSELTSKDLLSSLGSDSSIGAKS